MYLVVSCNTGGSDETPTLVDTGVPHRQRSQGGAVLTVTADRQKGSVKSRVSREEMGTDVEVSGVRGETSHHPRIKGQTTDRGRLMEDAVRHLGKLNPLLGSVPQGPRHCSEDNIPRRTCATFSAEVGFMVRQK